MAMVISSTTKAAIGGLLALMILGAVLVVGAAFGWFDPKREDEDTPAKISARLQGRTSFVTHRAVNPDEIRLPVVSHSSPYTLKGEKDDAVTLSSKCQCSANDFSQMLEVMPELTGPPGPEGPTGADGTTGAPGKTGQMGDPGSTGPQGLKGDQGERGETGSPGADGQLGPKGEPGVDGIPGLQGHPGPMGPPGPASTALIESAGLYGTESVIQGPSGERGPMGLPGPQGERGHQGNKGERGLHGGKGDKGDRGYIGMRGPHGAKGDRGQPGKDGFPGLPGAHGRPSEKGEKGARGLPGLPASSEGAITNNSVLSYITKSVLVSQKDHLASVVVVHCKYKQLREVAKLKGDRGERGEKGEKGSRGMEGPQGFPGNDGKPGERGVIGPTGLPGTQGVSGLIGSKGDKGDAGPPGPIALSRDEALILTKGDQGDTGPKGKRGHPGAPGPRGPPGLPGPPGAPGINGPSGDIGLPGWTGPPGAAGQSGSPGPKGEKGDSGLPLMTVEKVKGEKGDRGYDGVPGPSGPPGKDGATGPPGPAGRPAPRVQYIPIPGPPGRPGMPGRSVHDSNDKSTENPEINGLGSSTAAPPDPQNVWSNINLIQYNPEQFVSQDPQNVIDTEEEDGSTIVGTIIFKTTESLIRLGTDFPRGTLAFVVAEQALLIKVKTGWQYVVVGSFLKLPLEEVASGGPTMPPSQNMIETLSTMSPSEGKPKPVLRLATLNTAVNGDLYGLDAANLACHRQATRLHHGTHFEAFISTREHNMANYLKRDYRDFAIVNMRGELLFNSWNEMFDGSGAELKYATELYSFNGKDVMLDAEWPTKAIWHGYGPAEALGLNCASWHSGRPNSFGLASTLTTNKLLDVETYPCSTRLIVLCLERKPEISIKISKPSPRRIRKPVSEDDLKTNKTSEFEKTFNRTIRLEINPEFEITEEEFLEYNDDLNVTTPTDIV